MKINAFKTEVIKFSGTNNKEIKVSTDGQEIEYVEEFCYLGVRISNNERDQKEIKSRTGMARKAFHHPSSVLKNQTIGLHLRKRITKC